MIENGSLSQYQPPGVSDGNSGTVAADAVAMDARVCVDEPTRAQTHSLGQKIAGATAVVYVYMSDISRPEPDGVLTVALDERSTDPTAYQVVHVVDRVHAEQSHYAVFCKSN